MPLFCVTLPLQVPTAVVAAECDLKSPNVGRKKEVEQVQHGLAVVAVHPGSEALGKQETGKYRCGRRGSCILVVFSLLKRE